MPTGMQPPAGASTWPDGHTTGPPVLPPWLAAGFGESSPRQALAASARKAAHRAIAWALLMRHPDREQGAYQPTLGLLLSRSKLRPMPNGHYPLVDRLSSPYCWGDSSPLG